MPMVSKAQRAYLHIHNPKVAAEFERATPKGRKLPKYKHKPTKSRNIHDGTP